MLSVQFAAPSCKEPSHTQPHDRAAYNYLSGVTSNSPLFRVSATDLVVVLNIDNIPSGALGSSYGSGVTQILHSSVWRG